MRSTLRRMLSIPVVALALCAVGLLAATPPAAAQQRSQIVIDGSTTVGPIAKAFAEYYMDRYPDVRVEVSESGSGNGVRSLITGTCDIAISSRFMRASEFKSAVEQEVLPVAHVVAMDGIAVIVHPSNPVGELSLDQVRDIYSGKVRNWRELGGPNQPIVTISRDTNSGTYEAFSELAMRGERMGARTEYVGSNGAVRQRVQSTPTAVGYVGLGFLDRTVKALTIDGVSPSVRTVVSGRYPIGRPLFIFTNGYPQAGTHVYSFSTLHLTRDGQAMVSELGFVPVTDY